MFKRWLVLFGVGLGFWVTSVSARAGSPFDEVIAQVAAAEEGDPAVGNRVLSLEVGYDALLVRVHLIRAARRSIELQTFIWTDDESGRLLIYELVEAARRGVVVRIIADHLVSDQDPRTVAFLTTVHPNFQVRHYRPTMTRIKPSKWQTVVSALGSFRSINQRMHNKLMVVDGAVMITGGRNIENTYFDHSPKLNFRDRDVLAVGPVVRAAEASFAEYWDFNYTVPGEELRDVAAVIERGDFPRYGTRADYDFGGYFYELDREANDGPLIREKFVATLRAVERVRLVADPPGKSSGWFDRGSLVTRELRAMAAAGREDIVMQTPYLILSRPARRLVKELRRENPAIRIRISSNSFASTDNILAYSANYRLRSVYVEQLGLEVHEFRPQPAAREALFPRWAVMRDRARLVDGAAPEPFLCVHSKTLVVDDRVTFIGSYNLDPRSENLNTEIGLIIEDEAFAREMRETIEVDMRPENSWVIARRALPLPVAAVNDLVDGVSRLSPLDLWPVRNTASFELLPGLEPVPPGHPDFYARHRQVGSFPGAEGPLTTKEILTRIYKAVGTAITPVL
jgi:phosphatidylserine/phosphatidylglycerophosphate/cardiolipin synthase-like enzyme